MVRHIPMHRLQIETDAPWGLVSPNSDLAKRFPVSAAGIVLPQGKKKDKFEKGFMVKERNESCTISRVACIVAGLKEVSVEEVVQAAWKNSTSMFRLLETE